MSISVPERVSKNNGREPLHPHFSEEIETTSRGKVFLVGAGPGDSELITLKGLRTLHIADVVVYDRLVNLDLLNEAPAHAIRVFVGKESGRHAVQQEEINALLVSYAQQGYNVVRLKGGDPFVFGRGGEEVLALVQANVVFEVVSGVSSAFAVPAAAGIPVTHRGLASSVMVVTGHEDVTSEGSTVNWEAAAMSVSSGGTLVVLMGVKALPRITRSLIQYSLAPGTPAAVIQQGTTSYQRVVVDTLDKIANHAKAVKIKSPAITVVGSVVALSDSLSWFADAYANIPQLIAL
ncbi:MAG: hypothetical protein PVS3B3_15420 [Ktedonobacteraceae bacterium]